MVDREVTAAELTDEVEATLVATAYEANDALAGGVGLAAAARDAGRFPSLYRLHAAIGDALEMSLSPEIDAWLEEARQSADRLEALREGLVPLAAHGAPLEAALARFLLFEAVRARLLVAAWATDTAFEAMGGAAEDVDVIAAAEVARLVAAWPALEAVGGRRRGRRRADVSAAAGGRDGGADAPCGGAEGVVGAGAGGRGGFVCRAGRHRGAAEGAGAGGCFADTE
jgi:hypothetical protein